MKKKILLILGVVLIAAALVMDIVLTVPTTKEKVLSFDSTYKGKEVTLKASYFEVEGAEYGAVICPGYSCDRQKVRTLASLFVENGISVMSFDYAGQGESNKTIGFDNAKTDAISEEIADAVEAFKQVSGIDYQKTILIGHSMGGRSILRLLYDYNDPNADTRIEKQDIGYAILMAPEVNYNFNAQASLFAGTSDADDPIWASYSSKNTVGTDVYLFGSTGDDIVTGDDIIDIYTHLGGDRIAVGDFTLHTKINDVGSKVTAQVVPGVLHSFQFFDTTFAKLVNDSVIDITGKDSGYNPNKFILIYLSWIFVSVGAMLVLMALNHGLKWQAPDEVPTINDTKKFLLTKLLMWLPGIVVAFLVCCFCVVMPFGSPVMNIPYMCFIAGYGIWMLFCYRKGKFRGTEGKLPKPTFRISVPFGKLLLPIAAIVGIVFVGWYTLRASVYRLFPMNFRLLWLLIAGVLMAIGYYVSGVEQDMLEKANATGLQKLLYALINYIPLFLFVGFYLVIGSFSGLVQQLINVVLMYAVFVPLGEYMKKKFENRLYGALLSAFIFQGMMITSAALIAMF